jgi:hypothetical protein
VVALLLLACAGKAGETTCPVDVALADADLPCLCGGVEVVATEECEPRACEDGVVVQLEGGCAETGGW